MLPSIKGRFLEIGCGSGATLEYIKSKGASYVAGVDMNSEAINLASRKNMDFILFANAERDELPFVNKEFDCIILADVLEHLYDPWKLLEKITQYLKDEGCILLSIPNIKYYGILNRLIFHDEWTYSKSGILDSTHIRFFTLKEIKKLLNFANLKISECKWNISSGIKFKILNTFLFNKLKPFSVIQYYIKATKK